MEHDPLLFAIFTLWLIAFGAVIGSFLNVVVYRLPLRKSLTHPPSHCPACGHPIRWYDNIPVVGWIKLRGKCRDCQIPISIRYPCVEGFCGMLFGAVFFLLVQLCPLSLWGPLSQWSPLSLWVLLGLALLLSLLGTIPLAAGLIAYDRWRSRNC